jgi:hypothetical protein
MVDETRPFTPLYNQSQYINGVINPGSGNLVASATAVAGVASSASAQFPGNFGSDNSVVQIRISNKTSTWVHVNFGQFGNIRAATGTDFPVPPGAVQVVTVDAEVSGATVISDGVPASSTVVVFTRGSGT